MLQMLTPSFAPCRDMADYKRRKEAELGLAPGTISGSTKEGVYFCES